MPPRRRRASEPRSSPLTPLVPLTILPVVPCSMPCMATPHNPALRPLLPFARQFYASPSTYLWFSDAHECSKVRAGSKETRSCLPQGGTKHVEPLGGGGCSGRVRHDRRSLLRGQQCAAVLRRRHSRCGSCPHASESAHGSKALRRAAPRANYLLCILPPHLLADYPAAHDTSVARCLAMLLQQGDTPLPPTCLRAAQLAQRFGGLGLRSASGDSSAAHWASWQDTLPRRVGPCSSRTTSCRPCEAMPPCPQPPPPSLRGRACVRLTNYDAPDWDTNPGYSN